jgi:hypothetical protein
MSDQVETIVSVAVLTATLAVFYIVPLWIAWRVGRKGYKGWAWATGILTLFGIGLIVGGIALVVSRRELGPDIECPQCGQIARPVGASTLNKETGEEIKTPILGILAVIGGIALIALAGWMAVGSWLDPLPSSINANLCSSIGLMIMFGGSLAGWGGRTLAQRGVDDVQMVKYKCSACSYRWTQRQDQEAAVSLEAPTEPTRTVPQEEPTETESAPQAGELCWYCESFRAIPGSEVTVEMHTRTSGPGGETREVSIPRCARCQAIHTGADRTIRAMSTILVIISLAGCILPMWMSYEITGRTNVVLGIGIGVVVMIGGIAGLAMWNSTRRKRQGIKGAFAHKQEHPEVLALKEQGWDFVEPAKG